jgi:hypothetical protein
MMKTKTLQYRGAGFILFHIAAHMFVTYLEKNSLLR